MTERRSNRSRVIVNYSKLDDDDDFADNRPSPPISKTAKNGKENKSQKKKEKTNPINENDKIKSRKPPPEDRLLDVEINKAITISLEESSNKSKLNHDTGEDDVIIFDKSPVQTSIDLSNNKEDLKKNPENEIETIASFDVLDSPPRKRQKVYVESDSDEDDGKRVKDGTFDVGQVESESSDEESDSDFDPDEDDSDLDRNKQKNKNNKKLTCGPQVKNKTKPLVKTTTKITPNSTAKSTAKQTVRKVSTPNTNRIMSVLARTPLSSARKIPTWTPPGCSQGNHLGTSTPSMTSPSGGMRLGLSRNQRVKSLHPSLVVKH